MAAVTALPASDQVTGSWTTVPLFSKINDDVDAPTGTVIVSPSNPGSSASIEFTMTDPIPAGDEVDTVNLRIHARKVGTTKTMTLKVIVRDGSDVEITSFTTTALTQTLTNYNSGVVDIANITKANWANVDVRIEPTTTGGGAGNTIEIDALNIDMVTVLSTAPATGGKLTLLGVA